MSRVAQRAWPHPQNDGEIYVMCILLQLKIYFISIYQQQTIRDENSHIKNMKYLGVNLTNNVQDMFIEYKILPRILKKA